MRIPGVVIGVVAASLCGSFPVAPVHADGVPRYSIIDLGALMPTWTSRATGVNDLGQVVGRSDSFLLPQQGGTFIWTEGTGMLQIGPRANDSFIFEQDNDNNGLGLKVNNAGMVVGLPFQSAIMLPGQGTLAVPLPSGSGTPLWAQLTDLNNRGAVVGIEQESDTRRSYLWSPQTGAVDLGQSTARAVNDSGLVVGQAAGGASAWTPQTGWMALGIPDGEGAAVSWAGQIVVNRLIPQPTPGCPISPGACLPPIERSLVWTQGQTTDLGLLAGDDSVRGEAINAYGVVVGKGWNTGGVLTQKAIVFAHGLLFDLNALVPPGSGWILEDATAINNRGWIVGIGGINSNRLEQHAFLLRPVGEVDG